MRMTKKDHYIGLMNTKGELQLVYKQDNSTRMSYWATIDEINKKGYQPIKYTKTHAEEMCICLCLNWHTAFIVTTTAGAWLWGKKPSA